MKGTINLNSEEIMKIEAWLKDKAEWNELRRNESHCYDGTSWKAMSNIDNDEKKKNWKHKWN